MNVSEFDIFAVQLNKIFRSEKNMQSSVTDFGIILND